MIRPSDIDDAVWEVITAANSGDIAAVRRLLDRDPGLSQRGYLYTPPVHFAVREGHLEIVERLLASGADPEWNGHHGIGRGIGERRCGNVRDDSSEDAAAAALGRLRILPAMVNLLLARGAPTNLPDEKPWAKPLAWATRRGHSGIVSILRAAGADSELHP